MASSGSDDVTGLLKEWGKGSDAALQRLTDLLYDELRRLARAYMRQERSDATLQSAGLVHEAYLRLVDTRRTNWRDRSHFFAVAAKIMRRILVDTARRRRAVLVNHRRPADDLRSTVSIGVQKKGSKTRASLRVTAYLKVELGGELREPRRQDALRHQPRAARNERLVV